jgi:hypothetical protein
MVGFFIGLWRMIGKKTRKISFKNADELVLNYFYGDKYHILIEYMI